MAKSNNLRWTRNDLAKLRKEVKYYNQKVNRALRKGDLDSDALPPKMSVRDIRKYTQTREELNSTFKQLEFMRNKEALNTITNKYNLSITKSQMLYIQESIKKINKTRASERQIIESLPLTSRGTVTGNLVKDRLDKVLNDLKPKKFDFEKKSKQDWKMFVESVEHQSSYFYNSEKMKLYKENYLQSIETVFGEPRASEIFKLLEDIKVEDFMRVYHQDTEGNIDFNYDENETLQTRYESIKNMWTKEKKRKEKKAKKKQKVKGKK